MVALATACATPEPSPVLPAETLAPAPALPSGPIDLTGTLERAGFSLDPQGVLRASGPRHAVAVERHGFRVEVDDRTQARFHTLGVAGAPQLQDGAVLVSRGAAVERLVNTASGIEQSWRFEARPNERVDLRVEVEGVTYVSTDEEGLHFASEDPDAAGIRYGHATWIDASARRWPVPVRWVDGAIEISVDEIVLSQSTFPAVLDPTIGPELRVGDLVPLASPSDEGSPEIAFDGTNFLVVWEDYRVQATIGAGSIRAARVAPDGRILDPSGIALTTTPSTVLMPRVAAQPTGGWLVVWSGPSGPTLARRVAADGSLPDPLPFTVASGLGTADVTFDGTHYVVVGDDRVRGYIVSVRVRPDGLVLDPTPSTLATFTPVPGYSIYLSDARVAASTSRLLVTYAYYSRRTSSSTYAREGGVAATFDFAGTLTGYADLCGASPCLADVASDGSSFLVWRSHSDLAGHACQAAIFDGSAAALTPWGGSVSIVDSAEGVHADFGGGQFVTTCERSGHQVVSAISMAGGGLWRSDFFSPSRANDVASAGGGSVLRAYDIPDATLASMPRDVYGHRFDPATGTSLAGSPMRISGLHQTEQQSSAAWNGSEWLVAWVDGRPGTTTDVYAARLGPDGTQLDASAIPIARAVESESLPSVASNGTDFLVAWGTPESGPGIRAVRVTAAGAVLDGSGLVLSASAWPLRIAAASDGSGYLVGWTESNGAAAVIHVDAATGTLFPSGGRPLTGLLASPGFDLVRGASNYLALGTYNTTARGLLLDAAGTPTGSVFTVHAAGAALQEIHAAWSGTDFLAVWRSDVPEVRATRISASGVAREPLGVRVTTDLTRQAPSVAWDGNNWWVGWGAADGTPSWDTSTIFVRRVAPDATLVDASALPVPDSGWTENEPVLTRGASRLLLTYTRYAIEAPYGGKRVFARLLDDLLPNGSACTSDAQCSDGHCADSVCCNTACGGSTTDCQACSIAAGAATNGACSVLGASHVCRAASGACDVAESCSGTSLTCPVDSTRPDGSACSDGLTCNGAETCMAGVCRAPASLSCDDVNLCTLDSCTEPSGCSHAAVAGCCNVAADCSDGDLCTLDVCSGPGGTCSHPAISGCCTTSAMCADASSCTTDACDVATHTCVHAPIAGCCASTADCDDGNACTTDACTGGSCSNTAIVGCCLGAADCDDRNACTTDVCSAVGGACSHPSIDACCNDSGECDDSMACTIDSCNVATHTCASVVDAECCSLDADCDDGMVCTIDACSAGRCGHTRAADCCVVDGDCEDGNVCTAERCDTVAHACVRTTIPDCCRTSSECDDGLPCTQDSCSGGTCAHTPLAACDAGASGERDGGVLDGGLGGPGSRGGCGCRVAPSSFGPSLWLVLLAGVLLRRRRGTR